LIHGYNSQEHKVATYFSGITSDVLAAAPPGHALIIFDWPAVGVPMDELPVSQRIQMDMNMYYNNSYTQPGYELAMYGIDQRTAEGKGAHSLIALLSVLSEKSGRTITIVAHSMGCYLMHNALQQKADAFAQVRSIFWLAPDVDASLAAEPRFRAAIEKIPHGLSVHFSRNDSVLSRLSRIANNSQRLGSSGYIANGTPPDKMKFVDMTNDLGSEGVHGGYLKSGSTTTRLILSDLAAP
jgi:esterase/lipase superfamily enzyme